MMKEGSYLSTAIAVLERQFGCRFNLHGVIGDDIVLPELPSSHLNPYCSAVKRRYPRYENICMTFDQFEVHNRLRLDPRPAITKICPMGCLELVFPIRNEGRFFGVLFAGPFRPDRPADIVSGKFYECAAARAEFVRLPKLNDGQQSELMAFGAVLASFVASELAGRGTVDRSDIPAKIMEFVIRNLSKSCGIGDLAEYLELGRSRASELVRRHFGMTFVELLNRHRIDAVKFMLEHTSYSQRHIAETCGFRDPGYMHRVFRRREGESPGAYRKERRS